MLMQGIVGQQNNPDSATPVIFRSGKQGDLSVSELHGRYYESNYRKNKFYGSNGATPSVTTVALATTYTGLCLLNPAGSNVNVVIDKVGYSFLVAFPAAATIGLMVGFNPAGVTTYSAAASSGSASMIGAGNTPAARCALSATLPTAPTLHTVFGTGYTGAITTTPQTMQIVDLEGSVILTPGAYAAIYTSTVSGAASLAGSFQWEEVPV
jgi:hypothetical protein